MHLSSTGISSLFSWFSASQSSSHSSTVLYLFSSSFVLIITSVCAVNNNHHVKTLNSHLISSLPPQDSSDFTWSDNRFSGLEIIQGSEPPSRPIVHWNNPLFKPYFDTAPEDRNVTAQLGKSTFLKCRIKQITDETVSWVRQKDLHIISAGPYVYTSDERFEPKHVENTDEWYLHIKYVQEEDRGTYECQISTEPKKSLPFYLNVIEAKTELLGGSAIYFQSKDTINLTCVINQTASPPMFIYWHKDGKVLSFLGQPLEQNDARISVHNSKGPVSVSVLIIRNARWSDSGNYTCRPVPQYTDPANITVHVLNGENPAAMQHSNKMHDALTGHCILFIVALCLLFQHQVILSLGLSS